MNSQTTTGIRLSAADLRRRRDMCIAANTRRAVTAARAEAAWIIGLGELDRYQLPEHYRQAARLRCEHPDLTYRQLAQQMGVSKDSYVSMIRGLRRIMARQRAASAVSVGQRPDAVCVVCEHPPVDPVLIDGVAAACAEHSNCCQICVAAVLPGEIICGACQHIATASRHNEAIPA